jgi:hypothetical protein
MGETGQDREDRTARHDSGVRRNVDKGVWAEQLEQDSQERRVRTGQPGQDRWYRTAGTGKPEKTDWIVKAGLETEAEWTEMTARQLGRGGQPGLMSLERTYSSWMT